MAKRLLSIGLMSGTSMDGIDIATLLTDGERDIERGTSASVAYDSAFRERLDRALESARAIRDRRDRPDDLADIERELTLRHAGAVGEFLQANGIPPAEVDVIGFHGQTVLHRPDAGLTVQLGDGDLLARETGIPVVHDMRANDMRHGGQGAPLVPVYHAALASRLPEDCAAPVVFVNIGGISNITHIGRDGSIVAYDSGPGNMLLDQWVAARAGIPFDQGGMIAAKGKVLPDLVARYLDSPFFSREQRRSLDRSDFALPSDNEASLEDGARTLAHVTAAAIVRSAEHLPEPPRTYVVCGGGRLNRTITGDLHALAVARGARVDVAESVGLDGDGMEAEAWAYLAVRSLKGLPLTFPGTTGVRSPLSGGVLSCLHPKGR